MTHWKISPADASLIEAEVSMVNVDGAWHGSIGGDFATATGESINSVRGALAHTLWGHIQAWIAENGAPETEFKRIRLYTCTLFTTVRGGEHHGEPVKVTAVADRPANWVAAPLMPYITLSSDDRERRMAQDALSGNRYNPLMAEADTFNGACTNLIERLMQELDFDGDAAYPDWSSLELAVFSRKTFMIDALM
ncbi:hypothetical protein MRI28_17175 [Nocardiopsis dassonvillei]|uniref:hypothetical protein n=1 Tax=Nocardiopsis dassonvillei TaxID=2014 RepID=UPI00200F088C|nr:hypothetical protein [Nocardiopsis dassonvillei]MCK9871348.1 hypothetical protein [Nocardiopsis dassonvillei]